MYVCVYSSLLFVLSLCLSVLLLVKSKVVFRYDIYQVNNRSFWMSLTEMAGGMGGLMNTVSCVRNAARATTAKLAQPIHPLAYRALKMKLYLIDLFYPPSLKWIYITVASAINYGNGHEEKRLYLHACTKNEDKKWCYWCTSSLIPGTCIYTLGWVHISLGYT